MKKQLKDKKHIEAKIKITHIREHFVDGNCHEFKGKLICIEIDKGINKVSTAFPDTKKGHIELLRFIKEELYL